MIDDAMVLAFVKTIYILELSYDNTSYYVLVYRMNSEIAKLIKIKMLRYLYLRSLT